MSELLQDLRRRAGKTNARIALPEAEDPRILAAAAEAIRQGLCRPILVGDSKRISESLDRANLEVEIPVFDPVRDGDLPAFRQFLQHSFSRRTRIPEIEPLVRDPLYCANYLVRSGHADGAVMGAVATTSDTLRAALRVTGVDPRFHVVTSCFLMVFPRDNPFADRTLIYADCGVIPDPSPSQLAEIAIQAAETYRLLVDGQPRVALLSFSTKGSARHPSVEKVRQAVAELHNRNEKEPLAFEFDGELQADAALIPTIGKSKAPESSVAGRANVMIFPDLNSGNIAYKLSERLAGARAIGPLLRGLAQPIHDLSRGCSIDDILDTLAITALDSTRSAARE